MRGILILVALGAATIPQASAAPNDRQQSMIDLPLKLYQNGFNTDLVTIGTPAQATRLFVDWTWIGAYTVSTKCNHTNNAYGCLAPGQKLFNETQSTSLVNQTNLYPTRTWNPNHFFMDKDLTAVFASDIYRVGDRESRLTLQLSQLNWKASFPYPFSGIFGMSPVFKSDNMSIQAPFHQMVQQQKFHSGLTSFIYCYSDEPGYKSPPKERCNGNDGIQTLGGYHHRDIGWRGIEWINTIVFPIVNDIDFIYNPAFYNYWSIPVTKHFIGNEEQALNTTTGSAVVFDHASYGRGAAMSVASYRRLVSITNAQPVNLTMATLPNNGKQKFYSVDCDRIDSFPAVKYQFGKWRRVWSIEARHYISKAKTMDGKDVCVLNVRVIGQGENFVIGNLGENFAKDKVILFDFEKNRVGLADFRD
ncbi:hypothetical protein TRV_00510 [Trichophyton verrucosum HKI 0517]|uniref:Peptidase A1 domain-containing protein n=1 Tax=Trichophyton verrucosum (strain HKI 0517) TaxID=663202 RepID=D4D0B5_TRIVH|nr:uncharacterized protein TRV_00510 [Trichophyton verrucosum HKI 0517]EFE44719.1 hypothetical protein TRV_00510 [Trichophyton verrucosum HKI 0517]